MAKSFHKDMGDYLDKRKGEKGTISKVFQKHSTAEFKDINRVEDEIDTLEEQREEMEEDLAEPQEGFFSRMFKGLFGKKDEDEYDMSEEERLPELEDDVKRVLRTTFSWINQLPPDKKIKFKHSQDFVEYKAVLKKYGLAKEKEVEHAPKS